MKGIIFAFIFAALPAAVFAGADFALNGPFDAAALPELKLPEPGIAACAAKETDAAWIAAVKRVYNTTPQGNLPPAELAELPAAALRQMQEDAQVYPSKAYKIAVDGRTAYVIENDNLDALYVNIFDAGGAHIAYGGFDENYDFWWLTKK